MPETGYKANRSNFSQCKQTLQGTRYSFHPLFQTTPACFLAKKPTDFTNSRMRLRSREVSSDPETTSPTTSGNVSQEYQAADENPNQADPGEGHDGQGTATDEVPNWQDWPDQAPPSASPSEAWDPDRSAGSAPVNLGPPPSTFYQASEPKHVNGWSYEVSTRNEIYRISTVPKDFFGVTPNWPDELRQGHRDYKATEVPMHEIIDECNRARFSQPPLPDSDLYFLQERKYNAVLRAANARADFLKTFPSAFMEAKNHKDHVRWIEVLIGYINTAQTEGLSHYQA
jgi:hypothetical protein